MTWLSGWSKRQAITLTGGTDGSQVDFQLKLSITYDSDMLSDFSDLRFTDADGITLIDAWMESYIASTSADMWVKFPTTPANSDTQTYYMYYGKADAASDWNIEAMAYKLGDDSFSSLSSTNPVINPSQSWDAEGQNRWGTIALVNSTYYIYFSNDESPPDIGRATSTDLFNWAKDPNNPIINGVTGPSLLKELDGKTPVVYDSKYWMITFPPDGSKLQVRSASAIDSNSWIVETDAAIIPQASTWYSSMVLTNSFIREGSTYYIMFEGNDSSTWRVGYATASAPAGPYTVQDVLLSPTLDWEGSAIVDPEARKFGDTYYLFYTGNTGTSCRNSYATSSSLTGTYTKSEILLQPIGESYPAILQKDSIYYIISDNLNTDGKDLYKRSDLDGSFSSAFQWTTGGSPSVSSGVLSLNSGDGIESSDTFLEKAIRFRANWKGNQGGSVNLKWIGFVLGGAGSMIMVSTTHSTDPLYLKNYVSSIVSGDVEATISDAYKTYDIIWKSDKTEGYVNDVLEATLSSEIPTSALPVSLNNHEDATYDLLVDWVFVRKYAANPPTYGFGSEENAPVGASHGLHLIAPYTLSSSSDAGETGTIVYDSNYMYVCVATNTWKRVSISAW